jgi:hypothetical protein
MDVRSIIALFLGLVIQFSQVPSRVMDQPTKACATAMSCCEGLDACPCARNNESDQKPAPVIPASVELKIAIAIASVSHDTVALLSKAIEGNAVMGSQRESCVGFAGVPLSVAFCTFVI